MARLIPFQSSFVFFLVASMCFLEVSNAGGNGPLKPAQCDAVCHYLCSRPPTNRSCFALCKLRCLQCRCVPSGTSAPREESPCNKDGKDKEGNPCP